MPPRTALLHPTSSDTWNNDGGRQVPLRTVLRNSARSNRLRGAASPQVHITHWRHKSGRQRSRLDGDAPAGEVRTGAEQLGSGAAGEQMQRQAVGVPARRDTPHQQLNQGH